MPELPEVETVRRGLEPALLEARITRVELRRPNLRFAFPKDFAKRLKGRRIVHLGRRAKYLLVGMDGPDVLVVHLGMSGKLTLESREECEAIGASNPKHDHVVFHLKGGARLTYNDPRRFGFMDLVPAYDMDRHRLFCALGPEPLGNSFNAEHLARRARGRKSDLKAFLLDQHTLSGLGNIYVCEALYRARLSPLRTAGTLTTVRETLTKRAAPLVPAIRDVLREAIAAGGSSLKDYRKPDGALGYFQHAFDVYGRDGQACRRDDCNSTIARITQSGRSTFYCPRCQR